MRRWRASSPIRSCSPAGCASSAGISADARSRPRLNSSAKARPLALASYILGVKVTLNRSKGGHFIAYGKALPGDPYDGNTLTAGIPLRSRIGVSLTRIVRPGHNAPPDRKFRVYVSGPRRRVAETIKRELRRRSAVEPVIDHSNTERRMGQRRRSQRRPRRRRPQLQTPARWLALSLSAWAVTKHPAPRNDELLHGQLNGEKRIMSTGVYYLDGFAPKLQARLRFRPAFFEERKTTPAIHLECSASQTE